MFYTVSAQVGKQEDLRVFRGTCYCHGGNCAVKSKGITSAGTRVRRGVLAADTRILPLRTEVEIVEPENYAGIYRVEDRGRLIVGNKIDIWAPTQKECKQFGIKKIVLRILKK